VADQSENTIREVVVSLGVVFIYHCILPSIEFMRIHYALPRMWLSVGTGAEFHFKMEEVWKQNR
jgi:hypothetical protein